jgi:hypothetical protein
MTVVLAGCCVRPSSAWDQTTLVQGPRIPSGVVLMFDRKANTPLTCSGTVIQEAPSGGGYRAYVLTAKHCVDDDDPRRWGVVAPLPGIHAFTEPALLEHVLAAARVAASTGTSYEPLLEWRFSGPPVDWVDDWAILAVDSPDPLPVLPLDPGDTAALAPGTPVSLLSYFDWQLGDLHGSWYEPTHLALRAHPFAWTGVPGGISQQGHSGSPIVRDGRVVAVHSGADLDSNVCRIFCGTWPVALRLVNVTTVRREAEQQGLHLGGSP